MAGGHDIRAGRRYAAALFATARKQEALEVVEQDLSTVLDLIRDAPLMKQLWYDPLIPAGKKRTVLVKVLGGALNPLTLAFLRLLIDKRREEILEAVQLELQTLSDRARHLLRAEAVFALQPTPDEQADLQRSLEQRTGNHVLLSIQIDPGILGGVVVRMQDTIIDGSVRGTLERLREQLLQDA